MAEVHRFMVHPIFRFQKVHGSWFMAISKTKVVGWFINTPFYEPTSMNHYTLMNPHVPPYWRAR